jgi:hypothetical protein
MQTTIEHPQKRHPPDWELFRGMLRKLEAFLAPEPGPQSQLAGQLERLADNLREYLEFRDDQSSRPPAGSPGWLAPTLEVFRSHQEERIHSVSLLAEQAREAMRGEFDSLVTQAKAAVEDVCTIQAEKEAALRRAHDDADEA